MADRPSPHPVAAYWAQSWELRQLDRLRFHGLWIPCPVEGARA